MKSKRESSPSARAVYVDPADLYELLQGVRARPLMYLRRRSLVELERLCFGYEAALRAHGVDEFGTDFHGRFSDFLSRRRRWSLCAGWVVAIRHHARSPAAAWKLFFELVDKYRASLAEGRT